MGDPTAPSQGNYLLTTDGSGTGSPTNSGPGAVGVVLRNPRGLVVATISKSIGPATNTEAEYQALIEGLEIARSRGVDRIRIFVDSELLVDQLTGKASVKADHIRPLHREAGRRLHEFSNWRISWIPRAWNKEADLLATAARVPASDDQLPFADDVPTTVQVINAEGQAAWVSEHTDLPQRIVEQVLDLEFEFMIGVGIVQVPDHEFRYYSPEELQHVGNVVDTERLAQDAERFFTIPAEVALLVFDAEYQFLKMRGLAE